MFALGSIPFTNRAPPCERDEVVVEVEPRKPNEGSGCIPTWMGFRIEPGGIGSPMEGNWLRLVDGGLACFVELF